MKVIVLGAGIIGICTAWFLRQAGHDVIVIDRADAAAQETSFANAGQLSYGYTTPWAAANIPYKALKWLGKKHSPLILKPDGSYFQAQWLFAMLKNCNHTSYKINKERMVRISEYSRTVFQKLVAQTGIDFEGRQQGTLQIFRTQHEVAAAQKDCEVLAQYGVPFQSLSATDCLQYEPALKNVVNQLAGALLLPNDATGDCQLFATKLAQLCTEHGVIFHYRHTIERLETQGKRIVAIQTNQQRFTADHVVCALGCFSRQTLTQLGVNLPIYPVKGYSLTIDIDNETAAPQSTVLDETYKVAITRFNKRVRVGGMAELSGYKITLLPERRQTLEWVVNQLFPEAGNSTQARFWSGLRPMTPDSTPIIGQCGWDNLTLNTGHGTLGWTMSAGSGKLAADLVSGVATEIRSDDLGMARYTQ